MAACRLLFAALDDGKDDSDSESFSDSELPKEERVLEHIYVIEIECESQ